MKPKDIVLEFYNTDVFLDKEKVSSLLHPEVYIHWNTTTGLKQMNFDDIIQFTEQLTKAYVRSKIDISQIIAEKEMVSVRYSHFANTIENPNEEMLLANFIAIWEIKDNKLFRSYQMSQL